MTFDKRLANSAFFVRFHGPKLCQRSFPYVFAFPPDDSSEAVKSRSVPHSASISVPLGRGVSRLGFAKAESKAPEAPAGLVRLTRWMAVLSALAVGAFLLWGEVVLAAAHASSGGSVLGTLADRLMGPLAERPSLAWFETRLELHSARFLLLAWIGLAVLWLRWRPRLAVLGVCVVALAATPFFGETPTLRRLLVGEKTSVVDAAAAPTYLLAALLLIWTAWQRRGERRAGLLALAAVPFVIFAGEESSWGQHWFGYDTPEAVASVNMQGEFNLHNLDTRISNALFLEGALFAFLLVPYLLRPRSRRVLASAGFFLGCAVYFAACTQWRDAIDPVLVEDAYLKLVWINLGLAVLAAGFANSRFWETSQEIVRTHFVVSRGLRSAGLYAFAGWALFGVALGCIGALQLRPLHYLPNVDDELFEFLVAMLCFIFAADQLSSQATENQTSGDAPAGGKSSKPVGRELPSSGAAA